MTIPQDPDGVVSSQGNVLHEWSGGCVSPCQRMCFMFGHAHPMREDIFPLKNRPWSDATELGLGEFYSWAWPRTEHWEEYNKGAQAHGKNAFTNQGYRDPTLEWNPWWQYYARGVSKWHGE
jgi:hypothetical protein